MSTSRRESGTSSLHTERQKRVKQARKFLCAGMRPEGTMVKVPPKHKKHYFKAVTGLFMREEGSLELEDEHCREEVKEIFRD